MKSLMILDPFRPIRQWDPFEEIWSMQRDMDRIFDNSFPRSETGADEPSFWAPAVDRYVNDGKMVFKCELPGVDAKDLEVNVRDRELVLKGERKADKEEKGKDFTYREMSYGSFERRFELPEGAKLDDLKAKFSNGILEITVPVPAVTKARKIEIETANETRQLEAEVKKAA